MSNEYDYSGLYNNTSGGQPAQNNAPARPSVPSARPSPSEVPPNSAATATNRNSDGPNPVRNIGEQRNKQLNRSISRF